MTLSADKIKAYVHDQLETITDVVVRDAIAALLIQPTISLRSWYDDPTIQSVSCWVFALHPLSRTAYVYSELSLGEPLFWGIVNEDDSLLGMDSNWFSSLKSAFYDSFAAFDLPIWNVVRIEENGMSHITRTSLTGSEAWALRDQLNITAGLHPHSATLFRVEPRSTKS